jgi:DNA-binding FrmR family transcriptional regulator
MSHLGNAAALTARVRRIIGQLAGLERSLAAADDCAAVLQQAAAVRGAVNGLMDEILEAHLREHVAAPELDPAARAAGAEALMAAIRRYAK